MVVDSNPEQVSNRKLAIARAAAERIRDHNRVIIDSGSTTSAMIPMLGNKRGLIVMTNSLNVAGALRELENEPTLLMTGGTWDPHPRSFQGQVAEQVLRSYDFDQLFIGADGIDPERAPPPSTSWWASPGSWPRCRGRSSSWWSRRRSAEKSPISSCPGPASIPW